ncbi:hypothetical protein WH47_04251 [Habropoda laboriosa]|uniref:Uncharacterized protein n=1 Tax=Habropoda laboriosa TaxID=597456 RepID=A0A0L7QVD5_9HYME|nr:PREDICTED: uncharacterized protein LOC108574855 [Habropoda laboriosa]KOC62590.1 hypothetical protein WH47_04251 [Habropoda laboriosa]
MFSRTSKQVPASTGLGPRESDSREREGYARKLKRRSRLVLDCLLRRPSFVLLLLPAALLVSLYVMVCEEEDYEFEPRYPSVYKPYNIAEGTLDGYLVWNPRCHMLSKEPVDPSIRAYVKKEKFERCTNEPRFTGLTREDNGTVILYVDPAAVARYPGLECCWSPVFRAEKESTKENNVDSMIVVKRCRRFQGESALPAEADAAMVSCTVKSKRRGKPIYENVHAILNVDKVSDRFNATVETSASSMLLSRKLSVLLLGIDSVSRLNFMRSAPNTEKYLRETGWVRLNGYNKMGDNTFPNLMAILTGQNQAQAYSICKPTVPHFLDRCPFIWRNFRQAGYATAYGEDETSLNTFNYLKVGFVEPPTDYYLRPYMLACEKLLKVKKRFGLKYCTGPESSFDRILDYAVEFSRAFLGQPYFGFFWTISVSHENANGLSSMDNQLLGKLKQLEREGVLNDTMIVFLSDHGMRWGPIRNTFVGWYEERLPFLYLWLPEWFRAERPEAYPSVRANQHRLTSPFDLYETLREVLRLSGGQTDQSPGCPACRSLLAGPVPRERGCPDVGISSHWCTCTAFESIDSRDPFVQKGAHAFLEHVDTILDGYRDKKGRRLCAKLRLKKLHRVDRVIDFANSTSLAYFYLIQVSPGGGKFEVTMRYHDNNATFTVTDHDVSRINSYASAAECLNSGMKQYCYCLK